jgi:hypothetical protein
VAIKKFVIPYRSSKFLNFPSGHCVQFFFSLLTILVLKGSPVHTAPACAGSGEELDHFCSYVRSISLQFCKSLLPLAAILCQFSLLTMKLYNMSVNM